MSAFPDPACRLPGEAAFLSAVLADLTDDTRKLVYADWLEEQGDPRGAYLRTAVTDPTTDGSAHPKPWRDLCGLTLAARVREQRWDEHLHQFQRVAWPAAVLKTVSADESAVPVGASKMGGRPDLPAGATWPAADRGLLAFLAQFDLAALAVSPVCGELPATGLLSVFYDVAELDAGGWDVAECRVLYNPAGAELVRQDEPDGLNEDWVYQPCRLEFEEILTLPGMGSRRAADLPAYKHERYRAIWGDRDYGHQLLGHPYPLQNEPAADHSIRHLLTIDTDETGPGWAWGDTGLLYLTLPTAELAAGRFDRVWVEMQCC